jgi:GTPase SAR1 family protein
MKSICNILENMGYRVCVVYLLESQFIEDRAKFFSGVLSAMSAMIQLELPHINVLSKMDLLGERAKSKEVKR